MHLFKHMHFGHILFSVIIAGGIIAPSTVLDTFAASTQWFEHQLGWFVLLACAFFVGLCFYIAFSRFGALRLGGPDETPQFSTPSWLAMLFAAGMGSGLVFYGAAEPLLHYMEPPPAMEYIERGGEEARRAMALSFFHWGVHAWAIYAIAALSIAYFTFHRNAPMLPSVPITYNVKLAQIIDGLAIAGVVFGLVASLCQAVLQLSRGINAKLGGVENMLMLQLIILAVLFVCYMFSASSGIRRGIKILSNINIIVALLLMAFVLLMGPSQFIMESFVSGVGDYLDSFIYLTFNVRHFSDAGGWTEEWTITYFLWWVAWGPFVGVFIARISRGRTLREFILGVIFVPTIFSALWFATLGGTAIHLEIFSQPGFGEVVAVPENTTYAMLESLPLSQITNFIVLLLLFVFLVTSADSGAYVLGMFTSKGEVNPSASQRLFWGCVIGGITAAALATGGGTHFFRSVAVAGGVPYLFIMLWQSYNLCWAMKTDLEHEAPGPIETQPPEDVMHDYKDEES